MLTNATRDEHLALLRRALDLESLHPAAREAFGDMLTKMTTETNRRCAYGAVTWEQTTLYSKQLAWVLRCLGEEATEPDTRLSAGDIPRGREVPLPAVLRNLPKRPPGRCA